MMTKTMIERHSETWDDQVILAEFVEWLNRQGYAITSLTEEMYGELANTDHLISQYFGIDRAELERERRALLREIDPTPKQA